MCVHTNVILCCVYVCVGMRSEISEADLSKVLPEEVEEEVRQAAEISMGTEVLYTYIAHTCGVTGQTVYIMCDCTYINVCMYIHVSINCLIA